MKPGTILLLCATSILSSCETEDKALRAEYESQRKQITDLEFQIKRVNEKIVKKRIPDPSEDIKKLKSEIQEIELQKEGLLDEIANLRSDARKAADDLREYKLSYPIREN